MYSILKQPTYLTKVSTVQRKRYNKMTAQPVSRPAAKHTTFRHTQKKLRNFINKVSSLVQRPLCFLTVPGIRRMSESVRKVCSQSHFASVICLMYP